MRRRNINLPMEQVISDYQSGMSPYQLAKKYGVSDSTIRNRLSEAGVQTRTHAESRRWIELPVDQIASDYQSGMSPKQLAKKYGVSEVVIRSRLKEAGVRKITAKERNMMNAPMEQIISDYQSGMSLKKLGEKYGVSNNTIRKRLIEAGVQQERRGRKKIDTPMAQIWFDYESGMSPKDLGEKYGINHQTIRNRLKEAEKELN